MLWGLRGLRDRRRLRTRERRRSPELRQTSPERWTCASPVGCTERANSRRTAPGRCEQIPRRGMSPPIRPAWGATPGLHGLLYSAGSPTEVGLLGKGCSRGRVYVPVLRGRKGRSLTRKEDRPIGPPRPSWRSPADARHSETPRGPSRFCGPYSASPHERRFPRLRQSPLSSSGRRSPRRRRVGVRLWDESAS